MPMYRTKHHIGWTIRRKGARDHVNSSRRSSHRGTALSRQAVLLLTVHALFAAANALSGTFVNVYLWKVSNDLALIAWFAASAQILNVATFFFAGKWVKERNKMNFLRMGVAISAVFYFAVLLLKQSAVDYVLLLGAIQGMAGGLFWLSFNVVYFEVTGPEDRDRFNGWAGLLGSVVGMAAPWISGFLITQMDDTAGYRLVFGMSLAVFVLAAIVSFFLKKRKVDGHYNWFLCYRTLRVTDNPWRRVIPALAAQGVREGVFGFIIGLMVYIATKNEMKLGTYALITSAVALLGFWLAGKFLKPQNRNKAMMIGTMVMIAVIIPFFWQVNYSTLLLFGIVTALFFPLFSIPMTSTVFDIIGRDEESAQHREEYIVFRELGLNAGRLLGTFTFIAVIAWSTKPWVLNSLLLFIGSFPLLSWWFMRRLFR